MGGVPIVTTLYMCISSSFLLHVHACAVPVNKKFTFDDRRTIVLRCERLHFVPDEMVRERKQNGNGTERNGAKTVCKKFINYARKLSNALDREIGVGARSRT